MAVACDVADPAQSAALVQSTISHFGRIDIWINNAGFGVVDSLERMDMAACRRMFDTNLFGAIQCMQQVIPIMRQQRSGCIINVSSVAGLSAFPTWQPTAPPSTPSIASPRPHAPNLPAPVSTSSTSVPALLPPIFRRMPSAELIARRWVAAAEGFSEQVAQATLSGYLSGRREVIVPWFYNLVILAYRLLPGPIERTMRARMRSLP